MLIITGPTGSGKSDIALEIAAATNGVIINADSKQIYGELPIITNQPREVRGIRHELYGVRSVREYYSVMQWLLDAERIITESRGYYPIIVGGTGMYINALIYGISVIPHDWDLKLRLHRELRERGLDNIRAKLFEKDPVSATKISRNDTHRILRAYEVFLLSGRSVYSFFDTKRLPKFPASAFRKIAIIPDRERLYSNIDRRFLFMINDGAIEEARAVRNLIANERLPACHIQGFVELNKYLAGELTLDEAIKSAQRNTRRYAKRQITWIRNQQPDFEVFSGPYEVYNHVIKSR